MKNGLETSPSVWLISEGRFITDGAEMAIAGNPAGPVKAYDISDMARYLLDPAPIDIHKPLVGVEIHFRQPAGNAWRGRLRRWLPPFCSRALKNRHIPPTTLLTDFKGRKPPLRTTDLERHFEDITTALKPYDTFNQHLLNLDFQAVEDIFGVCEDAAGNPTPLALQGTLDEKVDYLNRHVGTTVRVRMENVQVADGLFEMGGYDFTLFRADVRHRMIKFYDGGVAKACVVSADGTLAFWVQDLSVIRYLQLAEQSIRINHKFKEAMLRCMTGHARPMKLMFNSDLEIDYSQAELPPVFQRACDAHKVAPTQRDAVKQVLNRLQIGISFNYVPYHSSGEEKLCTDISVMQDIRALEAIKDRLPHVYSEITQGSTVTEAGKYYLLEAIRGIRHAQ
ncbi:MAG: hypothetical protein ABIL58_26170 [Pseudomonadota bacterium]